MEKYRKIPKEKETTVKDEAEIRVTAVGSVSAYVSRAAEVYNELGKDEVLITGSGNAITKVVQLAEVVKRRFKGLHQITKLSTQEFVDEYEPLEEGLDKVIDKRSIAVIDIRLSKTALDTSDKGYQAPLDESEVKEYDKEEMSRGRGRGKGAGRGKGKGKSSKGKGKGKDSPKGKGRGKGEGKGKGKGEGKGKGKGDGKAKGKGGGKDSPKGKGKGKGGWFDSPKGKGDGKEKGKSKGWGKDDSPKGKSKGKSKDRGKGKEFYDSWKKDYDYYDDWSKSKWTGGYDRNDSWNYPPVRGSGGKGKSSGYDNYSYGKGSRDKGSSKGWSNYY